MSANRKLPQIAGVFLFLNILYPVPRFDSDRSNHIQHSTFNIIPTPAFSKYTSLSVLSGLRSVEWLALLLLPCGKNPWRREILFYSS